MKFDLLTKTKSKLLGSIWKKNIYLRSVVLLISYHDMVFISENRLFGKFFQKERTFEKFELSLFHI